MAFHCIKSYSVSKAWGMVNRVIVCMIFCVRYCSEVFSWRNDFRHFYQSHSIPQFLKAMLHLRIVASQIQLPPVLPKASITWINPWQYLLDFQQIFLVILPWLPVPRFYHHKMSKLKRPLDSVNKFHHEIDKLIFENSGEVCKSLIFSWT